MIPFGPWEPDKGPFAGDVIDTVVNALPLANGWGPMPTTTVFTLALPSECKGAWWFRATAGTFNMIAATQTGLYKLNSSTLAWDNISRISADTVTQGAFAVDASWTKGTNVTISGGAAHMTGTPTGQVLSQAAAVTAGTAYKIVYTVSNYSSGGVRATFTGGTSVLGTTNSANGTYTQYLTGVTGNTTLAFEAVDPAVSGENDAFTTVLLHMDGADASTTFTDVNLGGSAHTWTANGNAQVDTADSKFGGASLLCDGTGDYITTVDAADLELGNNDWTIDTWFKVAAGLADGTRSIMAGKHDAGITGTTFSWYMERTSANKMRIQVGHSAGSSFNLDSLANYTSSVNTGWHHMAAVRSGNTLTLYIDGVAQASSALSAALNNNANAMSIGRGGETGGSTWFGWIDEFRLSPTVARWTAAFTPPTVAYRGNYVTLDLDNVTMQALANYTGPATGELWTAAIFGLNFYITNLNDPLQFINIDSGANFANATGSPPQAKYIASVGDFLFLAHLKVGGTTTPRKWQHCAVNDPTDWSISGASGDSDDQEIPDGDDIVGIIPMPGSNARIFQRKARRQLVFSPGSNPVFQQIDMDAPSEGASTRGVIAPHAIVPIGSSSYIVLNETGWYLGDEFTPIGAERVDVTFLADVDRSKLSQVQAAADPFKKILWIRYQDGNGTYKMIGYNWQLDRWTYSNIAATLLVSSATPGVVLDSLPLTLDTYTEPLDSSFWQGGTITFGTFKSDNKLYLFAGQKAAATIETSTVELTPDASTFVTGAILKANVSDFTMQLGSSTLPDGTLSWSAANMRSSRTGVVPFRSDAKYHRIRLNVGAGGSGTHVHAVSPLAKSTGVQGGP